MPCVPPNIPISKCLFPTAQVIKDQIEKTLLIHFWLVTTFWNGSARMESVERRRLVADGSVCPYTHPRVFTQFRVSGSTGQIRSSGEEDGSKCSIPILLRSHWDKWSIQLSQCPKWWTSVWPGYQTTSFLSLITPTIECSLTGETSRSHTNKCHVPSLHTSCSHALVQRSSDRRTRVKSPHSAERAITRNPRAFCHGKC